MFFYQSFWKFLPFLYFKQKVPSIWWKPGRVVDSAFYTWRTSFWGKNEKSAVNYFSPTYHEKMSKNLWQTLQNCICLVLWNTLRKFVSLKIYFFLSGTLSVTFLPSGKQIQLASQNFILRVQKNNFFVKNTSKCTIFSFLVLTAKKSLRKYIWPNCQKCFWFVHCNNSRKFRLLKIRFFLSGSLSVSFMFLAKQNERRCQNNILRVRRFFRKKIFLKYSKYFHHSCTLYKMFWAFRWGKNGTPVKTAISLYILKIK